MKNIVVLDDNLFSEVATLGELKLRGYSLACFENSSELFNHLEEGRSVDLFILDVQLPEASIEYTDNHYKTMDGMRTGIVVAQLLRKAQIDVPIIFYSVAHLTEDIHPIYEYEKRDENAIYFDKSNVDTRYQLADFIDELFKKGTLSKSKWLTIFGNSIEVKPSFCGVGINLKEIFRNFKR
ncbi:MAG: CheY-like chemotaxis protein [Flavobacteriales bacterium]|jgi:CheY-like chemotaxis protein